MSNAVLQPKPRLIGTRRTLAIVASTYNESYVNALVEAARAELHHLLPQGTMPVYRVPGAYEIPVCAEYVAQRATPDVIIALGVIIRGKTGHADLIATSVANSLQDVARAHLIPVINEVLLVDNEEQARERCIGKRINRGVEAARAAANMAELFHKLNVAYANNPRQRS